MTTFHDSTLGREASKCVALCPVARSAFLMQVSRHRRFGVDFSKTEQDMLVREYEVRAGCVVVVVCTHRAPNVFAHRARLAALALSPSTGGVPSDPGRRQGPLRVLGRGARAHG
jgi:hypothetical protein